MAWVFEVDKSFAGTDACVELDFSAMQTNGTYPDALHNQGFSILCGGCEQYINIRFDATKSAQETKYYATANVAEDGTENLLAREFIIGVKDVTGADDLAETILAGIYSKSDEIETTVYDPLNYSLHDSLYPNTPDSTLVNPVHNLRIMRDPADPSKILLRKYNATSYIQFKEGTIPNPKLDEIPPAKVETKPMNPLVVHHGTQAGQKVHIFIGDMRAEALGITHAKVTTRENATGAISTIDNAISTALDEATNLGAWLSRMDYTNSNVTTMRDNVQNSESTIRDADMAKQMTEYTKYNILSQSAQTMLAQANQNQSSILGLLQ